MIHSTTDTIVLVKPIRTSLKGLHGVRGGPASLTGVVGVYGGVDPTWERRSQLLSGG